MKAEQIARALNDSEQRLQSVMESANDAIILANHPGLIMSWNQAARKLFGYTENDVIGRPFTLLLPARGIATDITERKQSSNPGPHHSAA